jgi:tetratricopeptide (TPR) repeat protein/predicted aspartyl protease
MGLRAVLGLLAILGGSAPAAAASSACTLGKMAELPVTMRNLRPTVTAKLNGQEASFLFDSGAFFSLVYPSSVQRYGLTSLPSSRVNVQGAGGRASLGVASAHELELGGIVYHRPDFMVSESAVEPDIAGIIGANLSARADIEYDLANGVIRFFQADGCKNASLAYWAGDKPYSVIDLEQTNIAIAHIRGSVMVNGVRIPALFDTGASLSILDLPAAARAGVTPTTTGVTGAGVGSGIALRSYFEGWIGPFDSFKIGDEEIRHTRLRFGRLNLDDADMLIGADFFLSHRIFVSRSQHKMYFTYNGGPVFNLGAAPQSTTGLAGSAGAGPAGASAPGSYSDAPTDAAGYSRRAAAFAGRREFGPALDDLARAIALEPASADYLYQRAVIHLENRQAALATSDLDQAIKLEPSHARALILRAELRFDAKDQEGAKRDFSAAEAVAQKDPDLRFALAAGLQHGLLWRESINQLDLWIPAHPKDDKQPMALNLRCWARAMLDQELDQALADCDAALRQLPDRPGFLDSRALVHLQRGEFSRGLNDYQAILKLQPDNPWALYGRGWARVKLGQVEQGRADIKAALALRPTLEDEAKARGLKL